MGHTKIDLETFIQIANALEVPPSYFLEDNKALNGNEEDSKANIQALQQKIKDLESQLDKLQSLLKEKDKQIKLQDELIKVLKEKR